MKINFLIPFIVFFGSFSLYAQREILPEIGFSGNGSFFGNYVYKDYNSYSGTITSKLYHSRQMYLGYNGKIGGRIKYQNKSFLFSGTYHRAYSQDDVNSGFIFSSDLLGVDTEFRLFEKSAVSLFFNLQLMSEVYSKYKNRYLEVKEYIPVEKYYFYPTSSNPTATVQTNIYKGTPILSNILIGCNLQLIESVSLNISAGYGLKMLRTQEATLLFDENVSRSEPKSMILEKQPYLVTFHMFNVQVGLNYSFSLHNNQKSKEQLNSFSNAFKSGIDKLSRQIVQPEIGTSIYTSNFGLYNVKRTREDEKGKSRGLRLSNSSYYGLRAYAGARFLANNRSLSLNFEYQYLEDGGSGLEGSRIVLKSNQVGLGAEFRMFEQNKVRLFFKMTTLTEVSSNFINSYLKLGTYEPTDFDLNEKYIEHPIINIYKGTPLINTLSIGSNIKIIKGLNLNFAIDYSMKLLRIEQGSMSFQSNKITGLFRDTLNLIPFHMFGFQAGLNYEFPVKKKPKMEIP